LKKSIHNILVLAQLDKKTPVKTRMAIRELPPVALVDDEAIALQKSILKLEEGNEEMLTCIEDSGVSTDRVIDVLNSQEYSIFLEQSEDQQLMAVKAISNEYTRHKIIGALEGAVSRFCGLDKYSNLTEEYEAINDRVVKALPFKDITTLDDAASSIVQEMLRVKDSSEELFYPTPFPSWNKQIDGVIPGLIYTIGAASNAGKSALACYFSYEYACRGKRILYISSESSDIRLYPRFSYIQSYIDGVPSFNRHAYLSTTDRNIEDVTNMSSRVSRATGNRVHFLHTSNPVDILSSIKKADDYDIIILDHLHNVDGVEEVSELHKFMVELQKTCSKYRRALLLFAQYNKTLTSKESKPSSTMLKGSGAILHCSDVVAHLWYPNYKSFPDRLLMYTEKNRDNAVSETAVDIQFLKSKQVLVDKGEVLLSSIETGGKDE
jgi:archaellum biogenesis ATPase FlaH